MKIGILTIIDYNNYGNRLQNYAMQEILKKLGNEVVTIKNMSSQKKNNKKIVGQIKKLFNLSNVNARIHRKIRDKKHKEINVLRHKGFIDFTKKYINETNLSYYSVNDDFSALNDLDCYVIGSDQVWNYNFPTFSEMNFAAFSNKPKIAYAASFGVYSIPQEKQSMYKGYLNDLNYISVREDAGKEIVEELSEKKADVVLDPTLLLDKENWVRIIRKKARYNTKFVVAYFLTPPSKASMKYIENYARKNNFEIKYLGNIDNNLWSADPADFVNIFYQAEAVFTDSFHGCVFSIIFHKEFEVFERNGVEASMNSRMDTLLGDFNLKNRWHQSAKKTKTGINFSSVDSILKKRKKKSLMFLQSSLNAIKYN